MMDMIRFAFTLYSFEMFKTYACDPLYFHTNKSSGDGIVCLYALHFVKETNKYTLRIGICLKHDGQTTKCISFAFEILSKISKIKQKNHTLILNEKKCQTKRTSS